MKSPYRDAASAAPQLNCPVILPRFGGLTFVMTNGSQLLASGQWTWAVPEPPGDVVSDNASGLDGWREGGVASQAWTLFQLSYRKSLTAEGETTPWVTRRLPCLLVRPAGLVTVSSRCGMHRCSLQWQKLREPFAGADCRIFCNIYLGVDLMGLLRVTGLLRVN